MNGIQLKIINVFFFLFLLAVKESNSIIFTLQTPREANFSFAAVALEGDGALNVCLVYAGLARQGFSWEDKHYS